MLRKLSHYTTALVTLLVLAGLYLLTVDRWLEPPPVKPFRLAESGGFVDDDSLADLFDESAWQRGPCKRLKTPDGMLLFQELKQTSRREWKFWPITVIVGRGLAAERSATPLIIDSREGAQIEFDEPLDVMGQEAPSIRGGQINGDVKIHRVSAAQPAASSAEQSTATQEPFEIRTSNVFIDSRKMWTTQSIEMQVGKARIRGRDLTLEFTAGTRAPSQVTDAASVLSRLELIYLHELMIPLPNERASQYQPQISVECDGRVQYEFALDQLRLRDAVTLTRQSANGTIDQFRCADLELTLRNPTDRTLVRNGPLDWLVEIKAVGSPASAELASYDCDLSAQSIRFHVVNGVIEAQGDQGVSIRYGAINAWLSSLNYLIDPGAPKQFGSMYCPGPGYVKTADAELPFRAAAWEQGIRIDPVYAELMPTGPNGAARTEKLHFLVDGKVEATLADGGMFRAATVAGDLSEVAASTTPPPTSRIQQSSPDSPLGRRFQPERVTATGDVQLKIESMDMTTEVLDLFFEQLSTFATHGSKPTGRGGAFGSLNGSLQQRAAEQNANNEPQPPRIVRGRTIVAKVLLDGKEVHPDDLTIRGDVELQQMINVGGQQLPVRLVGEDLVVGKGSGGHAVIQLRGGNTSASFVAGDGLGDHDRTPAAERGRETLARFELGDGFFVGPMIQIWPDANLVEIGEAGEFQIPTAILPKAVGMQPTTGDGQSIQWTKPPKCRWQQSMSFDGRVVQLVGGVEANASLISRHEPWDLFVRGERLELRLQNDVLIRDAETLRQAAIERLVLTPSDERPVIIEALRNAASGDGNGSQVGLQARHILSVQQLTYSPARGGLVTGQGPGWYRVWSRGLPTPGDDDSSDTSPANESVLTGAHLIFHDQLIAELANRTIDFMRGVRIGTRPVASWLEAFNAAKMNTIASGESTLDCDRMRITVSPTVTSAVPVNSRLAPKTPPWEMMADGGVLFRTRTDRGLFEGSAIEARYAAGKDLFTVLGSPNRSILFRHLLPSGAPNYEIELRSLTLNPRDMTVIDSEVLGGRLSRLPQQSPR